MQEYISGLRADQEKLDSRREKVSQSFTPFRDSFFRRLEQFTTEAATQGVQGIGACRKRADNGRILEATLGLSDCSLVVVAINHPLRLVWNGRLAARILVFSEDDEQNKPYIDIVVRESEEGPCVYYMSRWSSTGWRRMIGRGPVTEGAGETAADEVIRRLYSLQKIWADMPTLSDARSGRVSERPFGLIPPDQQNATEHGAE